MRKIVVTESVSLDGVMQSPAGRDEDTRGGFTHGGWGSDPFTAPHIGNKDYRITVLLPHALQQ